jgi:hypothetical protein
LCFLGLLLWQELPHAFFAFRNAWMLPHVQGTPVRSQDGLYLQCFTASTLTWIDHSSSFSL